MSNLQKKISQYAFELIVQSINFVYYIKKFFTIINFNCTTFNFLGHQKVFMYKIFAFNLLYLNLL